MKYRLVILSDNCDPEIKDYATFDEAAQRAVKVMHFDAPAWPAADIISRLQAGAHLTDEHHIDDMYIEEIKA